MKKNLSKIRIAVNCSLLLIVFILCSVSLSHAYDVTLEWDASPDTVDGYKLYYKTSSPGVPYNGTGLLSGESPIDVGNVTMFTVSGLVDGQTYYFALTAYAGTLESGYSNEVSTGGAGGPTDTIAPSVSSTSPAGNSSNVPVDSAVTVTFSEAIASGSLNAGTFFVDSVFGSVSGSLSHTGSQATFTPSAALDYDTMYTATITTGVADMAGNQLAADYVWSFTTAPAIDTTPPTIGAVGPVDGATGVAVNMAITATFNEAMDEFSLTPVTFQLDNGITGAVTYNTQTRTATLTPWNDLSHSTTYTATITTGAQDTAGNPLASDYSWSFTTAPAIDTTPPTISAVGPVDGATGVAVNMAITATFNEGMDEFSLTPVTFQLDNGVTGAVTYNSQTRTATLTPWNDLSHSTTYTATITTGTQDTAGNPLASDYSWSFTTESNPANNHAPSAPDLISPGNYSYDIPNSITFQWTESVDEDGDPVSYQLYYGTAPTLQGGETQIIQINPNTNVNTASFSSDGYLPGAVFIGFLAAGAYPRRRRRQLLIILAVIASLFLFQCGGGVGPDSPPSGPGRDGTNVLSHTIFGLQSSTIYHWKVVASDNRSAQTESEVWSFSTL